VMNSPGHVRPGATEAQRKLLLRNAGSGLRRRSGQAALPRSGGSRGSGFGSEKVGRTLVAGEHRQRRRHRSARHHNGGTPSCCANEWWHGHASVLIRWWALRAIAAPLARVCASRLAAQHRCVRSKPGRVIWVRTICACTSGSARPRDIDSRGSPLAERPERSRGRRGVNQILTVTEGKGVTGRTPFRAENRKAGPEEQDPPLYRRLWALDFRL
jgi:hypothetical protein